MAPTKESLAPVENTPDGGNGKRHGAATAMTPWWRILLDPKWLALFVLLSFLLPGMMYGYFRLRKPDDAVSGLNPEVSLGEFRFLPNAQERSPVVAATFHLHVALLPETDALARARLVSHQYRVQQGVEQLLRKAHGGDFEDPSLGEIKRQLQEQINETLGMRAVADVIVTGLDIQVSESDAVPTPAEQVAGNLPWSD